MAEGISGNLLDPAAAAVSHGPGGLMSYTTDVTTRPSADAQSAVMQGHPRGRGFSILSRLAREREVPSAPTAFVQQAPEPVAPSAPAPIVETVVEPTPEPTLEPTPEVEAEVEAVLDGPVEISEWRAPVVPLERPQPRPRHRRDVDVETDDFVVSAVPVARRSS
jgi:hypothetical protein